MGLLRATGQRMVFWGSLALLAWAAYELSIRIEEMQLWLSPVYRLVQDGKISWMDYLRRVHWAGLRTHLFLLVCGLFSVYSLLTRKRIIPGLIAIAIAVLLSLFSLGSTPLLAANIWQKLKLTPLLLIALGQVLQTVAVLSGRGKDKPGAGPTPARKSQPYDPFGIKGK